MTEETEAWRSAFNERHQFDVYPEHFMSGMRNEFCAGWHAALKSQAAGKPKAPIDTEALTELVKLAVGSLSRHGADEMGKRIARDYVALLDSSK